ncbi:glycosyltransferase family 2 protein [Fulvivirgaceae bacterium PWU4]|uniref:Glycosyltransferase family 2 protein n=1 Tax=Chryseosolibacter histidini TaxID=2782349 RepID=A0AAP2DQ96_9BACT|nr:glycosyltransferase family A protein [Chryseosolibacter histidini]MBT1700518.1 glycosyltransferase family 2 protein [Chryseosolibacter histidini]
MSIENKKAPVLIMVYNRLEYLKKCIESLKRCDFARDTTVYISSDAPYKPEHSASIEEVRNYIRQITGFGKVVRVFHEKNKGLAKAYSDSFEILFRDHDRFIFLEDDVVVAPDFLKYMNEGLSFYEHNKRVYSISAFSFSVFFPVEADKKNKVYFQNRFNPWGFAMWKDRFLKGNEYDLAQVKASLKDKTFVDRLYRNGADLYPAMLSIVSQNKMLALDYLNVYHMVKHDLLTVSPYVPKSFNVGNDGSGTRTRKSEKFTSADISFLEKENPVQLPEAIEAHIDYSVNKLNFNSRVNKYKLLLDKAGLLRIAMMANNFYKTKLSK